MPEPSTGHVFMSYSRRDDAVMRRITAFLRQQGIKVWVDNEKLIPGTPIWEVEIEKAIKSAPAIVVVLSPDSKGSEWVRREISLADQYQKRVFPVLVRGDEESSISLRLIGRQYVDIRNYEEAGLNYVSASILRYLQELDVQEQNTKKEASRLAAQKTRTEKRLAKQKADEERIAREKENTRQVSSLTDENEKLLATQKAEGERIAREKAETERKAKMEVEHLAAQKAEDERIAREKVETERKAKIEADRFAAQKAEVERIAGEKEELKRRNAEIHNRSREAAAKTTRALLSKLKIPAVVLVIGVVGYFLWQGGRSIQEVIAVGATATQRSLGTQSASGTQTAVEISLLSTFSAAETLTAVPTQTNAVTQVPTLGIGSTMTGTHGETLVYVPKGEFTMGSDSSSDEQPIRTVYLDAFWIDQFEVTNEMYAKCVDDKDNPCPAPTNTDYFNNSGYANHPVVYVNWEMAKTYCQWAGGDLPTEAQWEKAARGTEAFTYPWGNDAPNKDLLNYNQNVGTTTPVGSYESGKSPYNAYDMAGNVWEWVNDYYQSDYYATSGDNASNPQGPTSSEYRVLRGGAWDLNDLVVRSALRNWSYPAVTYDIIGFRCSRSLPVP